MSRLDIIMVVNTCLQQSPKSTNSIVNIISSSLWNTASELRDTLFVTLRRSSYYTLPDIQRACRHSEYVEKFISNVIENMKVILGPRLPVVAEKRLNRVRPVDT